MARQTAVEKAEIARAAAEAREAAARAEHLRKKGELAGLLTEVLNEALTTVAGSASGGKNRKDSLDLIQQRNPWPPRFGGGGHRDGQALLRRFSAFTWLGAVPSVFSRFSIEGGASSVPDEFWSLDELDDGNRVAVIACPCGQSPVVPFSNFHICKGDDCARVFFNMGQEIRVARFTPEELDALANSAEN